LDGCERSLVVRMDSDHPGVDDVEGGQLVHRRGGAVVVDLDLVEQGRVCPAGADRAEVLPGDRHGLLHLLLRFEESLVDHRGSPTSLTCDACAFDRTATPCATTAVGPVNRPAR